MEQRQVTRRILWVLAAIAIAGGVTLAQSATEAPRINVAIHTAAWTRDGRRIVKVNYNNKIVSCAVQDVTPVADAYIPVPLEVCLP